MKAKFQSIAFITLAIFSFSSCSKHGDQPANKLAIMKMEVSYSGDIQSQVAVLTFLVVNANNTNAINIVNENTGAVSAGPFLQNSDLTSNTVTVFHSAGKVSYVSIMLALSPKVYVTTPQNNLAIIIKIYFDGNLADSQKFSYDKVTDGTFLVPKDYKYKIEVK
jgi:hypothetical protein